MKKQIAFLSTAAAVLMMAGVAHAEGGGYVGASYSDSKDTDINAWSVDGAFQFGSNIQIDGGYTNIHDSAADEFQLGGHFFSRGEQWLWGGYVGYDRVSGGGDVDEWTVAGQTQYYADTTILSGDLSYSQFDVFGTTVNTTQLSGDARFFANENFSAHLGAGYGHLAADGGGDGNFVTYGGGLEWQPTSMPISIYGDVDVIDPEGSGNSSTWTVGVRYNWGGSIQDRYRNGAGLDSPHGLLSLFL